MFKQLTLASALIAVSASIASAEVNPVEVAVADLISDYEAIVDIATDTANTAAEFKDKYQSAIGWFHDVNNEFHEASYYGSGRFKIHLPRYGSYDRHAYIDINDWVVDRMESSFQNGVDSVDITTDNQESYDEGYEAGFDAATDDALAAAEDSFDVEEAITEAALISPTDLQTKIDGIIGDY